MYDDIDPRNLPVGTVVDGYTILSKLGGGGMGEIYRAQRGREVFALKLQGERLTDAMDPVRREELEARSRREAAVLLSLNHPNILAIVGSGRWPDRGGYLYLITEYVVGEPLDAWHVRRKPSLRQLGRVFERVADALDYMHRAGIYHRDLKDPNVLVREDDSPVVIDLGIARSAAAYTLTRVGAVLGTTTHLSPGVCRYLVGEKSRAYRFGAPDDLHALGFMLYERLTGTPPFRERSDVEWPEFDYYRQVIAHIPPPPRQLCPTVPESLSSVAMRLLAKTPEAGYANTSAFKEDLAKALQSASNTWDAPYPVPRGVQRPDVTRSGAVRPPQPEESGAKQDQEPPRFPPSTPAPEGTTARAIAALGTPPDASTTPSAPFHPPTPDGPPQFVPPEDAPPEVERAPPSLFGDTHIQRVAEQLQANVRTRPRIGPLGLLFVGAAALILSVVIAKLLADRSHPAQQDLLTRYQQELAAERQQAEPPATDDFSPGLPQEQTPPPPSSPQENSVGGPLRPPRAEAQPPSPGLPDKSAPSPSDAKAIQRELERAYGNKRPTLAGKPGPASVGMPSWVKGVEVVDAKPAPAGEKRFGGRYGDHLRLQLKSNLDSRLCGSGAVEAVLVLPYLVNGDVVLPARTLAYGQCAAQGSRFLIAFNRLRLPDGREVHFDGAAMDVADGKPGLVASRRLSTGATAQESISGTVVRGTASTALGAATGGGSVGAQLAGGAGQTVLNAAPQRASAGGEEAILLDAGAGIDVFIRQGF
jgi:eukaryotic-like serine/threonine-protein kinase